MLLSDRFELGPSLGAGAVGEVFAATDLLTGETVAVKRGHEPGAMDSLRSEYRLLRELGHPGLPVPLAFGVDPDTALPFLAMELLDGCDWLTWSVRPGLTESCRLDALAQLIRVLGHLHDHAVAHGDVSPRNLLVRGGGDAPVGLHLLDLGLAGGQGPGALEFAAPERLRGAGPQPESDWFSLGVLAHWLFAGGHPWPGYPRTLPDGQQSALKGIPTGGALADWIRRLLSLDATPRKVDWRQLLSELSAATGRHFPEVTAETVRFATSRAPRVRTADDAEAFLSLAKRWSEHPLAHGIWLRGTVGGGRSRLLADAREAASQGAGASIVVRCRPNDLALDLVRRAVRAACTWLPERARRHVHELVTLESSDTAENGSTPLIPRDADPRKLHAQRLDRHAQALVYVAQQRPLAILVDDADWADADSRRCLLAALREATGSASANAPLLIVYAGNDPWDGATSLHTVSLLPLDLGGVTALIHSVFPGRRVDALLAERLWRASGGLPLLVVETLNEWQSSGELEVGSHHVALSVAAMEREQPVTARSVERWMADRLLALPPEVRATAELLCALDADASPEALSSLLELAPAATLEALERLEQEGLCVRAPAESALVFGPSPTLTRAVQLRWPAERVRAAHLQMATLLEGSTALRDRFARCWHRACAQEPASAELAQELVEVMRALADAGSHSDVLRLASVVATAKLPGDARFALLLAEGESALALSDFERAHHAFSERRAVAAGEEQRAHAEMMLGALAFRRGNYGEADAWVSEALARLDRDADAPDELRAEALSWLAQAQVFGGNYDSARESARRAELILEGKRDSHATALLGRVAQMRGLAAFYQGRSAEAAEWLELARERFRACQSVVDAANVTTGLALLHHRQDRYREAVAAYQEALAVYERMRDRARQWATLMNLGVVFQEEGDYGRALESYQGALDIAEAIDDQSGVIRNCNNLGNALRYVGDFEQARRYVERSVALAEQTGDRFIQGYNLALLGEMARVEGARRLAAELLQQALDLFTELGCSAELAEVGLERAWLALDDGRPVDARDTAMATADKAREQGLRDILVKALTVAAEAERSLPSGDGGRARALLDEAASVAQGLGNREAEWPVLLARARLKRDAGELEGALEDGKLAWAVLSAIIDRLPAELRRTFVESPARRGMVAELRWVEALQGFGSLRAPVDTSASKYTKLLEVNKRLNEEHDLIRLLEFIMDSAVLLTGAERGFLLLRDPADGELRIKVARNFDQENIKNVRFKISRSIAERVLEQGEPIITIDAMEDSRYREYLSIHSLKLRSILCVPMSRGALTEGVLYLDNRFQVSAFGDQDLHFMEAFADQAAIAIQNARLLDDKERALTELEASQKKVAELNRQLEQKLTETRAALAETRTRVERQQRQLEGRHRYENIVGQSGALREVLYVVERLLDNTIPVLVTGESGTGKELVARAIHFNGLRRDNEFVAVNCGSIPATLFESELFGHTKGAFTGATSEKKGLFEVADRGTLFLDEIGELPLDLQVKLLRVLQSGEIQKVGGTKPQRVDVRIVAATNRDLKEEVRVKRFREDLYYRLNVVHLPLPPLRDRKDDIPQLVQHFLKSNRDSGLTRVHAIDSDALALLASYGWPGNIRELDTVIKNASVFAEGEILTVRDFAHIPELRGSRARTSSEGPGAHSPASVKPGCTLEELEREAISRTLESCAGNKKRAAELLGIDRRTLYNKLAAYDIRVERKAVIES
jgi:transcriptional regulator with GAF, ATPase, and Fis domain